MAPKDQLLQWKFTSEGGSVFFFSYSIKKAQLPVLNSLRYQRELYAKPS